MDKIALLIADDDADVRGAARLALGCRADAAEAASLDEMAGQLSERTFDVVMLDMNFALGARSGRDGLEGLARIQASDPTLSVVLMTAFGAVSLAVESLKRGGADFLLKPWRNDALVAAVETAAARTRQEREGESLELDDIERGVIEKALKRHEGNIVQAAAALGLSRPALYRRMSKYGL
ncbi:MAG: response regulator [Alphaproteobacteria bacterium]|nr:response regulator [Alphaproteobacteria bacterium]